MSREGLNWLLFVALVITAIANWVMGRDPSEPNYVIMPDMMFSVPYDSFAANPNFPDGKTLQPPVEGTLARGQTPLYYEATPEDATRAGEELRNPYTEEDADVLERGGEMYRIYCLPCHGPKGKGDGQVAFRGFPPPPSLSGPNALRMKDGKMFHIITYGQGNMPGYAAQVPLDDRWKIVTFVRSLQRKVLAAEKAAAEKAAAAAEQQAAAAPADATAPRTAEALPQSATARTAVPAATVENAIPSATGEESK